MVSVDGYLPSKGVTSHKGWSLTITTYCSPDGKRIAGVGINPQGVAESWIVTLP